MSTVEIDDDECVFSMCISHLEDTVLMRSVML